MFCLWHGRCLVATVERVDLLTTLEIIAFGLRTGWYAGLYRFDMSYWREEDEDGGWIGGLAAWYDWCFPNRLSLTWTLPNDNFINLAEHFLLTFEEAVYIFNYYPADDIASVMGRVKEVFK
jgi:hypothetical protein